MRAAGLTPLVAIPLLLMAGAATAVVAAQSRRPIGSEATPIAVQVTPVPLNPDDHSQQAVGPFVYAGGVALTSRQTDQLHGLSDLEITGANRITAVSDDGLLLTAQLVLDRAGRVSGVSGARLAALTGENGAPLGSKEDADAEGLAILRTGDRLVSFERRHRIWRYPASGGRPRPVPSPDATSFPANAGMEALAADPDVAPDAYIVGVEATAETWTCRVSAGCTKGPTVAHAPGMSLVALRRLPLGRTAVLLRGFSAATGARISLLVMRAGMVEAQLELARPLTVDNFEGMAAVGRPAGVTRFYLMSDDNGSATQRTLLVAFDWRPPR